MRNPKTPIIAVYTIKCKKTGWIYYGASADYTKRIYIHKSRLRSGKHPNKALQIDFGLHGELSMSMDILKTFKEYSLALKYEKKMIRAADRKKLYNFTNRRRSKNECDTVVSRYLWKNNITNNTFARKCKVSSQAVWLWAGGKATPCYYSALRMENVTKGEITVEDFYPRKKRK